MERSARKYQVEADLTASTSVQEFSKIFEGLHALDAREIVNFRIVSSRSRRADRIMRISIRRPSGEQRLISIDIADDPRIPGSECLEDVYFKRSCCEKTFAGLDPALAAKVRPFGMNNPAIRLGTAMQVMRARLRTGRAGRELGRDARQLFALPSPRMFEISPETPAQPLILFQTRLWSPATTDAGREEINEERAHLIRTLRAAFGHRFLGGAVPTDFVRSHYPDVVTPLPFSMRAYPRLLRRPLIAVYSRGLRDSLAFKMSEYLAASRCIVGHMPRTILPAPLVEGEHLLSFTSAEECVARCEELLSRPADAEAMRQANWRYYGAQVEPAAHLLSILDRSFEGS